MKFASICFVKKEMTEHKENKYVIIRTHLSVGPLTEKNTPVTLGQQYIIGEKPTVILYT